MFSEESKGNIGKKRLMRVNLARYRVGLAFFKLKRHLF